MTTIRTIDGKRVVVGNAFIEVSRHDNGETYFTTNILGTLPGCRKMVTLSISPSYRAIVLRPLYGYVKEPARVNAAEFELFVRSLRVESSDLFPVEITPELAATATEHEASICRCPAVTNR